MNRGKLGPVPHPNPNSNPNPNPNPNPNANANPNPNPYLVPAAAAGAMNGGIVAQGTDLSPRKKEVHKGGAEDFVEDKSEELESKSEIMEDFASTGGEDREDEEVVEEDEELHKYVENNRENLIKAPLLYLSVVTFKFITFISVPIYSLSLSYPLFSHFSSLPSLQFFLFFSLLFFLCPLTTESVRSSTIEDMEVIFGVRVYSWTMG